MTKTVWLMEVDVECWAFGIGALLVTAIWVVWGVTALVAVFA